MKIAEVYNLVKPLYGHEAALRAVVDEALKRRLAYIYRSWRKDHEKLNQEIKRLMQNNERRNR